MLTELLGLLLFWPYIVGVICFIVICLMIEDDWLKAPIILILGFLTILHFTDKWSIIDYLKENYITFICITISYLLIGTIYSIIKWILKLKFLKNNYNKCLKDFLYKNPNYKDENGKLVDTQESIVKFKEYLNCNYHCLSRRGSIIPQVKDYKDKFICWIIYWPFSLVSHLINDTLKTIFNIIKNSMQKISNKFFSDIPDMLK